MAIAAPRILVVDDEPTMLENCQLFLSAEGYEYRGLSNPSTFREVLAEYQPEVLLLDLVMPQADGMTLLTVALADDRTLPVIMMTAYATVASAVEAIREGAFDYLTKPFKADELLLTVERAVRHRALIKENRELREQVAVARRPMKIHGSSPAITRLLDRLDRVSATDSNVLILGESGTGKELVARTIHERSRRRSGKFVPIDCAALPEGLLESEMFGHERGAFTSADTRKHGLLEEANGGTVFLDELTELSPSLQAKLLRTLEERQIRRLGGSELIDVDIRVLAATNADLDLAVSEGDFRKDLFYRLNVIPIKVPPLRERGEDVRLLLQSFLAEMSAAIECDPPIVAPEVWVILEAYAWPGNVRELKNVAERLVALDEDGVVTRADLPENLRPGLGRPQPGFELFGLPYELALDSFRASYFRHQLEGAGGNVTRAAAAAGVSRRTFHRWLAGLDRCGVQAE